METELQQILDLINSLKDGNNNTAAQVREVLTAMANYNGEGSSEGFEIASEDLVTTETQIYHYSFKGIRKQCCNAYLLLNNTTKVSTENPQTHNIPGAAATAGSVFVFNITEEEYKILSDFIPNKSEMYLTYVVTTFLSAQARWMAVYLDAEDGKTFKIEVATNLAGSEMVTTAIALNYKRFTMPKANTKVVTDFSNVVKMRSSATAEAAIKARTAVKTETVTEGKP